MYTKNRKQFRFAEYLWLDSLGVWPSDYAILDQFKYFYNQFIEIFISVGFLCNANKDLNIHMLNVSN